MALKPAIHGRDHCPGGADPIPCLGSSDKAIVLHEYDYDGVGDNLVADGVWESVATGTGSRWWLEGMSIDDNVNWGVDLDTNNGSITRSDFGIYTVTAGVGFPDVSDGDILGVAIRFHVSANFLWTQYQEIPVGASSYAHSNRVTVSGHWWGNLGNGIDMWVYQLSGDTKELGMVDLAVVFHGPFIDNNTYYFEHE